MCSVVLLFYLFFFLYTWYVRSAGVHLNLLALSVLVRIFVWAAWRQILWYLCHLSIRVTRKCLVFQVKQHGFEAPYAVFHCCHFRSPFVACVYYLSEQRSDFLKHLKSCLVCGLKVWAFRFGLR